MGWLRQKPDCLLGRLDMDVDVDHCVWYLLSDFEKDWK